MPSYEAVRTNQFPGYLISSSHGDNFFSEEERTRRRKVIDRISARSGKYDLTLDQNLNAEEPQDFHEKARRNSFESSSDVEKEQFEGWNCHSNITNKGEDNETKAPLGSPLNHKRNEAFYDVINNKNVRDKIATKAFYTSATQKFYQNTDWDVSNARQPPSTVIEPRPDMVTQRIKRYEDAPEGWQKFSSKPFTWDYLQTRNGHFSRRPFAFTSQSKKVGQIPNYMGHISGEGERDVNGESFTALTRLRQEKPRYTTTSKRGHVPGYTGCIHWANAAPPLSAEKEPRQESTARVHKRISTPRTGSSHRHLGPLSKTVTLTNPFNPYNKKYPHDGVTASGNRD